MKNLGTRDKADIIEQLQRILKPSVVVKTAIDPKRMIAYAAVEYHGGSYLPNGHVYGVVARIYEANADEKGYWNYNFVVTSDEMPAESYGIAHIEHYCHCPIRILRELYSPKNESAKEWRAACFQNAHKAEVAGEYPEF